MSNVVDYSKMKVDELKELLKGRSLPVSGRKLDLVKRLYEADGVEAPAAAIAAVTPKKKDPLGDFAKAVRKADLPISDAFAGLMKTYGLQHLVPTMLPALSEVLTQKPPAPKVEMTKETLDKLTVADLKKILKENGQKVGGKKEELVARILNPEAEEVPAAGPPPALSGSPTGSPLAAGGVSAIPPQPQMGQPQMAPPQLGQMGQPQMAPPQLGGMPAPQPQMAPPQLGGMPAPQPQLGQPQMGQQQFQLPPPQGLPMGAPVM